MIADHGDPGATIRRALRAWLTRSLLAAAVQLALLGPLVAARPRPMPAIVASAPCRDDAERVRRGAIDWVLTLPPGPVVVDSLN